MKKAIKDCKWHVRIGLYAYDKPFEYIWYATEPTGASDVNVLDSHRTYKTIGAAKRGWTGFAKRNEITNYKFEG